MGAANNDSAAPLPERRDLQRTAHLIRKTKNLVVLTGAGFSTPSGIPDFRSPQSGLWSVVDPFEVATLSAFRRDPQRFFDWLRPLASMIFAAEPNPAHYALARLESGGFLKAVITQNIDGLHQKSGSRRVYEIHGSLGMLICMGCYRDHDSGPFVEAYLERGHVPRCTSCRKVLKPAAILFEEQLPAPTWKRAEQAALAAGVFLAAGSSLEVMPAAGLPIRSRSHGARMIIINRSPTPYDRFADVVLRGDVAEILPLLSQEVLCD